MDERNTGSRQPANREELMSALFANMVLQQTNLAMMLLGRVPHPETGERVCDLDSAQMFIHQLEMIETKTKNNLTKQEDALLRQSLTAVRMAYVEAAREPEGKAATNEAAQTKAPSAAPVQQEGQASTPSGETPPESEETRKKFTKKY